MNFQESNVFEHKRAQQAPHQVLLSSIPPERQAIASAGIDRLEALSIVAASATSLVPVDPSLVSSPGSRWSLASQQGGANEGGCSPSAQEESAPQRHLKPSGGWPLTSFQGDQRREGSLRFRCDDEDDDDFKIGRRRSQNNSIELLGRRMLISKTNRKCFKTLSTVISMCAFLGPASTAHHNVHVNSGFIVNGRTLLSVLVRFC